MEDDIAEIKHHLANLNTYTINYFKDLLAKHGKDRERKTELRNFDVINARKVVMANEKLYVDRKNGFVGYGLKKEEYVCDCSDISNVLVVLKDGTFIVKQVSDKDFVGKNIIYVDVWIKGNERKIYHAVYLDGATNTTYVKRFSITAITRDKEYNISQGTKGSKLLYFSVHNNSEEEVISILLALTSKAKNKAFEFDFGKLTIKGRSAKGNILTKYSVKKITQKSVGSATLGGRKVWLDETVGKLNTAERGRFLGEFDTGDTVLVLYKDATYEMAEIDFNKRFEMKDIEVIEKLPKEKESVISVLYYHGKRKANYVKRFQIETSTLNQKFPYLGEDKNTQQLFVSTDENAIIYYQYYVKRNEKPIAKLNLSAFVDVKGWKSLGNKLTDNKIIDIKPFEAPKTQVIVEEKPKVVPKKELF